MSNSKENLAERSDDSSSDASNSDSEFESRSQAEDFEDYKLDGYHPVSLGETFTNSKYTVIQKLGWGHFSTVWLVNEKKSNNYFALKIQKSKKSYFEAAMDELHICEHLNKQADNPEWRQTLEELAPKLQEHKVTVNPTDNFVIKLCDNFVHYGMHGKHPCSVFEVMGPNLLDLIQHFEYNHRFCDVSLVKHICIQILLGLDYIHRICNVIHTDLKPENVMFALDHLELEDFVKDLQNYKKKPLSMKFLKFLKSKLGQTSKKNKKKYQKKKNKKKNKQADGAPEEETQKKNDSKQVENEETIKTSEKKQEESVSNENLKTGKEEQVKTEEKKSPEIEKGKVEIQNQGEEPYSEEKKNKDDTKENGNNEIQNKNAQEEEKKIEEAQKDEKKLDVSEYDPKILRWKDHVLIHLDERIRIKLVDFGNGCWTEKHFTDRIQTREYRSPEAILGIDYSTTTDIWSFACMVFEMLTNTFLFKPRKGEDYGKNEDHLALMIETLGKIPKNLALSGKKSRKFFNKNGQLIRIKNIKEYRIKDILMHDFSFEEKEAGDIEEFLLPMLEFDPKKRIDARTALKSKWLWT